MKRPAYLEVRQSTGARLRAWRAAKESTVSECASRHQIAASTWYQIEAGRSMLPILLAVSLHRLDGVDLNALYGASLPASDQSGT
jgi:transcriptional regulator with XRE-family HTH domain